MHQNKQNKRPLFSAKNKQSISETNFTKSKGKIRAVLSFQEDGKKSQNGDQNRNYPSSSHSSDRKIFPFKKGFIKLKLMQENCLL